MLSRLDELIQVAAEQLSPWIVGVLMATALFFSIRLRFIQITRFREALGETLRNRQSTSSGALGPLQAFLTSLAATIGVGNIVGVSTAIVSGGPGALFWIWCYGFFAMATKFSEAALGLHFRVADGETALAGPMFYLRDGLKSPALAWIFALVAGLACLLTTPFTQPNSVAGVLDSQLKQHGLNLGRMQMADSRIDVNTLIIGCILAVLTWLVIVGGIKAIGRAAEKLSPLKVALYVVGGMIVIGLHATRLPEVFGLVLREAFTARAAAGGTAGWLMINAAMRYGVMRGVYANEAGYGTAAVIYGVAKSARPEQQGLGAMMEVFIISFVTSTISALAILVTGTWLSAGPLPVPYTLPVAMPGGGDWTSTVMLLNLSPRPGGPEAIASAFHSSMPTGGGWMLAIAVFLFGYSALIGWAYYGEQFLEYLFGPRIILPYRWLYCLLIPFGAVAKVEAVWNWGDILNGLQVFPNVIGIIGLSGLAAKYARRRRSFDD